MRSARATSRTRVLREPGIPRNSRPRVGPCRARSVESLGFCAMHARLAVARKELPRAVRIAVAATLAWWIAGLLGADRPVFAAIVPMVAIRDDAHAAFSLSLGRMLGVMAGVVLGIGAVAVAGVSTSAVILLLVVGLAIGLFLSTGPELNTQIAISALLVLVVTEDADTYAVERIWETAVGSVVSLVVAAFVLPPDPLAESERRLAETARALAADLADAQGTLTRGDPSARALLARADEHARAAGRAVEDLPQGAARAAHEPAAAWPSRRSSRSSTGASGSRCGSRSRRAGWPATSPASRTAKTCGTSGTRPAGACRRSIAAVASGVRQGARRRGLLARGRRVRASSRGVPPRGRPAGRGDPAPAARPARRRARGAAGMSSSIPAGRGGGSGGAARARAPARGLRRRPPALALDAAAADRVRRQSRSLGRRRSPAALLARAGARRDGQRGQVDDRAPGRGDAAARAASRC